MPLRSSALAFSNSGWRGAWSLEEMCFSTQCSELRVLHLLFREMLWSGYGGISVLVQLACLFDVGASLFCGPWSRRPESGVHPLMLWIPFPPPTELAWGDSYQEDQHSPCSLQGLLPSWSWSWWSFWLIPPVHSEWITEQAKPWLTRNQEGPRGAFHVEKATSGNQACSGGITV